MRSDPRTLERLARLTDGIEGFLSNHEAAYLDLLGAHGPGRGAIVEIGSYKGKSTVVLAAASLAAGREKVIAVDPFRGGADPDFRANLARAGVAEHVVPLVQTSRDAAASWTGPIRLLWIDGRHDYDGVGEDFALWSPFVVPGGVIAFHDTLLFEGVRRFVDERILRGGAFAVVGVVDSIVAARQVRRPTLGVRARNAAWRGGRELYWMNGRRALPGDLRRLVKRALRACSHAPAADAR